jgi:hypothetical protein
MAKNKAYEDGELTPEFDIVDDAGDRIKEAIQKDGGRGLGNNIYEVVGICANCQHFDYIENDIHQVVYSACRGLTYDNPIGIGKHCIKACTSFNKKGELSLSAMFSIATLIEPGEITGKRREAGFMSKELKEEKDE